VRPHVLLCALFATFALSACFGRATYHWKEEVLLHDGRVIVIERSVRTGEVRVELGQWPGESDYTLTFTTADDKAVRWEPGKPFRPRILDFSDGTPYVVARGNTGPDYEKHGCQKPPYFIFRWTDGRWQRIDYEQLPKDVRKMTLSASVTGDEAANAAVKRGRTTVEDVKQSHRWLPPHYREVREDVPNPCATWRDDYRYAPSRATSGSLVGPLPAPSLGFEAEPPVRRLAETPLGPRPAAHCAARLGAGCLARTVAPHGGTTTILTEPS